MADGVLTAGIRRWVRLPVAARIAVVYLAARLVTTLFLLAAAGRSTSLSRFGASPGLDEFITGWDAQWYWLVAESGYPSELPRTDAGDVDENAWAFMPVYAYAAKLLGFGVWGAGALALSLVAGYLACIALHRLLHERIGDAAAMWAVVFFASGPLAAMFQVGYAEALFALLLLVALGLVVRRRYGWLYLLIPVMGFTRPGILAFALLLGLVGIMRWMRRSRDPLPAREIVHIVALGALATAVGFSWQVIAAVVTGEPGAYLATELAWRRSWVETEGFVPFEGFVQAAMLWFTLWGMPGWLGVVVLLALVAGFASALLFARPVRAIGPELRLWSASYALYLLAVFFPQSSVFRLLMPLTPLWGAVAVPRSRPYRLIVLGLCLLGQWLWIFFMYGLGQTYWQIP